jgi:CheY-like chemotaxis protein
MNPKPKVLLVDDDKLLQSVLHRVLAHAGYDVILAGNGREALAQYKVSRPDVVLTDIIMPEKEGLETIMELRRHHPTAKIIAMSGGGLMDPGSYLAVARKLGVTATLAKPFGHQEMLGTLESLLSPAAPQAAMACA